MRSSLFLGFMLLTTHASLVEGQPRQLPVVTKPWYASAQLADHDFELVLPGYAPSVTGTGPWRFTVGRWLSVRWAVEASYSPSHFLTETTNQYMDAAGMLYSRYFYAEDWVKGGELLLRRRLTRNSTHRIQFDALAGTAVVAYRDKLVFIEKTDNQVLVQHNSARSATNAYFLLGPAVSCRFGRHFEVAADFLLTKNFHSIDRTFSTQQLNSTLGFQRGWSLGLRYRFAMKKNATAMAGS